MRKALKIAGSAAFVIFLSGCLFYCMVAGAGNTVYLILAALLSVAISVTLCAGYHYICWLRRILHEIRNKERHS